MIFFIANKLKLSNRIFSFSNLFTSLITHEMMKNIPKFSFSVDSFTQMYMYCTEVVRVYALCGADIVLY